MTQTSKARVVILGAGRIGRVDVDFFSHPDPTGTYCAPSVDLRVEMNASARAAGRAGSAAPKR